MKKFLILLPAAGIIFISCSSSDFVSHGIPTPGSYGFYFADSAGARLSEGIIYVDSVSSIFLGKYEITLVLNSNIPGPIRTNGEYQASYNEKSKIYGFNLNPKVMDANVLIAAVYNKGRLRGTWVYSTMMGLKGKGIFVAIIKD